MKVVAFVPIKFKSQRLENKNILPLGNKPLCYYIFETLTKIQNIDNIYVYCSDPTIKQHMPFGITFMERPKTLDHNDTKGLSIYKEFIKNVDADIYILAHATSPFIKPLSIQEGLNAVLYNGYDSSFSVKEAKTYCWYHNKPLNYNLNDIVRTQDLEPIYIENSAFYIFQKKHIQQDRRIGDNPYKVITNKIESVDIDEIDDYILAQNIFKSQYENILTSNKNIKYDKYKIKLIVLDFDGTMSDGKVHIDENNKISKCYNTKDGLIIKKLANSTHKIIIISGGDMNFYTKKAQELNINIYGNVDNKLNLLEEICNNLQININDNVAFMGDDDNDLELIQSVAISACPNNASKNIKSIANYISLYNGGEGAVRDFLENVISF
jgi:YrbI family 3-deoxy-D-manno-octulosonate 8-phosphate phosphatase